MNLLLIILVVNFLYKLLLSLNLCVLFVLTFLGNEGDAIDLTESKF